MVNKIFITIGMIAVIVLLLYIAAKPSEVVVTTPSPIIVEQPQVQQPTPIERPTPRAEPEPEPLPPGPSMEDLLPTETNFWVNTIRVPDVSDYEGYNFIPVKKDDLKTFAGSFGPYFADPSQYITVILCSELYKVKAAPACQRVQTIYRDNYMSFAAGFASDEYIGGMAVKDYLAYYVIKAEDTVIGHSSTAVIRTVNS